LSEEEAGIIISDIDEKILETEEIMSEVESSEDKSGIRETANTMSRFWKKAKNRVNIHTGRLINAKVGEIIKRSEHLEEKMDCTLASMEEEGIETSEINDKVDLFSKLIIGARDKFKTSREYFQKAREIGDETQSEDELSNTIDLVAEAKALVREAHDDLNEAHTLLKEIMSDIRDAGGKIIACKSESDLGDDEVYVAEGDVDDTGDIDDGDTDDDNAGDNDTSDDDGTDDDDTDDNDDVDDDTSDDSDNDDNGNNNNSTNSTGQV